MTKRKITLHIIITIFCSNHQREANFKIHVNLRLTNKSFYEIIYNLINKPIRYFNNDLSQFGL